MYDRNFRRKYLELRDDGWQARIAFANREEEPDILGFERPLEKLTIKDWKSVLLQAARLRARSVKIYFWHDCSRTEAMQAYTNQIYTYLRPLHENFLIGVVKGEFNSNDIGSISLPLYHEFDQPEPSEIVRSTRLTTVISNALH